jgi:3-deoxy-D-manno-octulosonate 8-phosphate phosphatase KdsC-like HAD superfamily phosphatase
MAVYTIAYKSKCTATTNPHYVFDIKRGNTVLKQITVGPEELNLVGIDVHDMAMMLVRVALKTANPTTPAEARTAIENISVTI